jgi:hypothetical protein
MKYLIRADKLVFSGNKEMIIKYVSDFYKSESKQWLDKNGVCQDFGKFKMFIESMGYKITDKIPSSCRCEGTAVSISDFKKVFFEEGCSIKATAERLHISERTTAQLARKLKVRK